MNKLPLLAVSALLAFTLSARAITITVGGVDYDVTTIETSYNLSSALLQAQPWWADSTGSTALLASTSVGVSFGPLAGNGPYGPVFAFLYAADGRTHWFAVSDGGPAILPDMPDSAIVTYALAVPVSTPEFGTTLSLLCLSMVGMVATKLRMRRA